MPLIPLLLSTLSQAQFVLDQDAKIISPGCSAGTTTYKLTSDSVWQTASIWTLNTFDLTKPLNVEFMIYLGAKPFSLGADGICFVIQKNRTAAGNSGGGIGYSGINHSLAVEFDTYPNAGDPSYAHVSIEKNGDVVHNDGSGNQLAGPVKLSPTSPLFPDSAWHTARITWDPSGDSLSVYFDCTFYLSYQGNIVSSIFLGNPKVYWGFTSSTGNFSNLQEICIEQSYLKKSVQDTFLCAGKAPIILTATGGQTYSWSPSAGLSSTTGASVSASPLVNTTYVVTVTDACGSTGLDSIRVRTLDTLSLQLSKTNPLCASSKGSAAALASGGSGIYTYSWSNGFSGVLPAGFKFQVPGLSAGTYSVTVSNAGACPETASIILTAPPPMTASALQSNPVTCADSSASALATAGGGNGFYTYSWTTSAAGKTLVSDSAVHLSGLGPGNYTLTVTDANGCIITTTGSITALLLPDVKTGPDQTIHPGQFAQLTASSAVSVTYSWTPSDSISNPNNPNPLVHPSQTTTYTVTVRDANNCTASATETIFMYEPDYCDLLNVFVPTAFSPNGDGENDILFIHGTNCMNNLLFQIYDRWGELVFSTNNPRQGWDGSYKGKPENTEVFAYSLTATMKTGQAIVKKGNITLLR